LLNDILDVSALDVGKMAINPSPVQLTRLLHDVDALMRPLAKEKHLEFALLVDGNLPDWVQADGTRIKQILLNLVSNAIKFSAHGRIALGVECKPLDDVSHAHAVALQLCVSDQGIGMDSLTLDSLFQRFSQGDASISRRFGGTGLGLEISRSLARLMGGDITVQSQPGHGSQFSLALVLPCVPAPLTADQDQQAAQSRVIQGAVSEGLDIVVAEDHPVNRKYMEGLLSRLGHRIRFAEDGEQAIAEVQRAVPDVLFMDVHMPVMDGLEATQALRAGGGAAAGTYIVALTADAFAESRERALAAGMDDFLSKPVRMDQIEALLLKRFGLVDSRFSEPDAAAPTQPLVTAPRRFRSEDVARHLDMSLLGEVCVAVSLDGYRSLLDSFFQDESRSLQVLLTHLDGADTSALSDAAHAFKGGCASLGFHALAALAGQIERAGRDFSTTACTDAAQQLRSLYQTAHALCRRMGLTHLAHPAG
jgi:CheY-like chemotaxis protein